MALWRKELSPEGQRELLRLVRLSESLVRLAQAAEECEAEKESSGLLEYVQILADDLECDINRFLRWLTGDGQEGSHPLDSVTDAEGSDAGG